MRWIPLIAVFLYVYIEISLFIQVAHVMGVFLTLVLVIFTSVIGMSLVRNQGFKNFMLMQQKMAAGESPAVEMIKSVSLIIAGLLLLLPGFFTDFLGLLLLLPPVQKHLTLKLMPHLRFSRTPAVVLARVLAVVQRSTVSISVKMMLRNSSTIVITTIVTIVKNRKFFCFPP